jgi:membrane protease subunit HflK
MPATMETIMAWNEPGGNKPKDPWGGGNDGPPDLDEALKKFNDWLGGIFGGGSGGSGSGSNTPSKGVSAGVIGLVAIVLAGLWAASGFYQIDAQERGVVLRLGKYFDTVDSGLQWNPRLIDTVIKVNSTAERQYTSQGLMLTEDENIVELPLTVQYNIADVKAFALNVRSPEMSLQHATDSALRHVVGSSTLVKVLSDGREQIAIEVKQRLQDYLDDYRTGIRIIEINLQRAEPPREVKAAFDDVIEAKEDKERYKNEAQAYANGLVPESRGKAQRILEEANAYKAKVVAEAEGDAKRFEQLLTEYTKAPKVTRERLYIDTVEEVMASSTKVLVDVDGGNNMMYLPLDKLTSGSNSSGSRGAASSASMSPELVDQLTNQVLDKLRKTSGSSRRGEER